MLRLAIERFWNARILLVILCGLVVTPPAFADTPAPVPPASPSADQMRELVNTLQDDQARSKLIQQLNTMISATEAEAGAAKAEPPTIGSRVLALAATHIETVRREISATARSVVDLPLAVDWITTQFTDSSARQRWGDFITMFVLIIVVGSGGVLGAQRILARPQRLIIARTPASLGMKLPFFLLYHLLKLAPIAVFAAIAFPMLGISDLQRAKLAGLGVINAAIFSQIALLGCSLFFDPRAQGLRLIAITDETAQRVTSHLRRVVPLSITAYFLIEAAFVLGLPLTAYGFAMHGLGFILLVLAIRLILRNRDAVAAWMRETPLLGGGHFDSKTSAETPGPRETGHAAFRQARRRFAEIWHIIVIAYVCAVFVVWSFNIYNGFEYLARATGETLIVAIIARLAVDGAMRAMSRLLASTNGLATRLPHLDSRAKRYHPILSRLIKSVIWLVALGAILDAWGCDFTGWIASPLGQRVLGGVITVFTVLAISMIAWEVVSILIEIVLTEDENRPHLGRSARAKTLLPLFRNAVLVMLIAVVSLTTLSELGVNIAPLLAGAGVVGVAIGFGSQTLVKDVITGLFILFEDTIAVGHVVDVGGGHSGVVEALSIRTIRLRDISGAVHSIPFSAVTSITNMTKDFSFAVFDVQVAYNEDPDRVTDVLRALGRELQSDPAFRHDILAPLEVMGLDQLADSGIILKARFKTRPMQQWAVGREFNRRILKRFNELGISIPFPHLQLVTQPAAPERPQDEPSA